MDIDKKELKKIYGSGNLSINKTEIKALFNAIDCFRNKRSFNEDYKDLLENLRKKLLMLLFKDEAILTKIQKDWLKEVID